MGAVLRDRKCRTSLLPRFGLPSSHVSGVTRFRPVKTRVRRRHLRTGPTSGDIPWFTFSTTPEAMPGVPQSTSPKSRQCGEMCMVQSHDRGDFQPELSFRRCRHRAHQLLTRAKPMRFAACLSFTKTVRFVDGDGASVQTCILVKAKLTQSTDLFTVVSRLLQIAGRPPTGFLPR